MRLSDYAKDFLQSIRKSSGTLTVGRPVRFIKAIVSFVSTGITDNATGTVLTLSDTVVSATVPFKGQAGSTASRPSAATVGAGAEYFDTDLGHPIWSDGSAWVTATGGDPDA